jgi:hypothetical protein
MKAIAISNKNHSLYSYALVQLKFESEFKFIDALDYMKQAYGPGIYHDRFSDRRGYRRNTGDNRVWYYADVKKRRYGSDLPDYKIYLTTPEQLTMVSLFVG